MAQFRLCRWMICRTGCRLGVWIIWVANPSACCSGCSMREVLHGDSPDVAVRYIPGMSLFLSTLPWNADHVISHDHATATLADTRSSQKRPATIA